MPSRKIIFTLVIFRALLLSNGLFAQSLVGLGYGYGSFKMPPSNSGPHNKVYTVTGSNSPGLFFDLTSLKQKNMSVVFCMDLATNNIITDNYSYHEGGLCSGNDVKGDLRYDLLFLHITPWADYKIALGNHALHIGIGPQLGINFSKCSGYEISDWWYCGPNFTSIISGHDSTLITETGHKIIGGLSSHISIDFKIKNKIYFSPQVIYRLNGFDFFDSKGFSECYFTASLKIYVNKIPVLHAIGKYIEEHRIPQGDPSLKDSD